MNLPLYRSVHSALHALALLFVCAGAPAGQAAESPTQLAGTWTLVLVDNILPDGSRVHLYGASPQGLLMFDGHGRYALQILRSDRPRFAANDKGKGTPAENQAAVQGSNTHFGTCAVNEVDHTLTFRIEHASFPNWEGTEQKRSFALTGEELTYTVPTPTTGTAATGEVVWRRLP